MNDPIKITVDAAGRLLLPSGLLRALDLAAGAELLARVEDGAIHLVPVGPPAISARGRRLVISAPLMGPIPDHRDLREEREASRIPS